MKYMLILLMLTANAQADSCSSAANLVKLGCLKLAKKLVVTDKKISEADGEGLLNYCNSLEKEFTAICLKEQEKK